MTKTKSRPLPDKVPDKGIAPVFLPGQRKPHPVEFLFFNQEYVLCVKNI